MEASPDGAPADISHPNGADPLGDAGVTNGGETINGATNGAIDASALAAFDRHRLWVAWRTERRDGELAKVPYDPAGGRKAKTSDPATWGTRAEAEALAERLLAIDKMPKGIGLILGPTGDGRGRGGIDLDRCLAPDGTVAPWAMEIVERFGAYTEISPSGTGLKGYFLYAKTDLPALRAMLGEQSGRKWAWPGGDHPPAIELYLDRHYFAVTDRRWSAAPLADVDPANLRWLVEEALPAFLKAAPAPTRDPGTGGELGDRPRDGSRSGAAFRLVADLRRAGKVTDLEGMRAALLADPRTAEWCREKGEARRDHGLRLLWQNTDPAKLTPEVAELIEEFNERYMIVKNAGKTRVYEPERDPVLRRTAYHPSSLADLRAAYMNRRIEIGSDQKSRPVYETAANVWLGHPARRQYLGGLVFDPSGRHARPDAFNLWQGFAVEPKPGSWERLREHARDVVCQGVTEHFDYLLDWLANVVQYPGVQGESALVLKGVEGTGKGILLRALMHLFGQHAFAISHPKHLVGNFNLHLRDCVFLFADEAFYAGDKQHIGVLKSLITEPVLTIEGKGENTVQAANYLHIGMASNEKWVVPASMEARRFFVLNVGEQRLNDFGYFAAIQTELEAGGYEAMLHDLLHRDLSKFNKRCVPKTAELGEQKKLSMDTTHRWWEEVLHRGYVFESKLGLAEEFGEWTPVVTTELLHRSYEAFAAKARERYPVSREWLGRFLNEVAGGRPTKARNATVGEQYTDVPTDYGGSRREARPIVKKRAPGYNFGELALARKGFVEKTGLTIKWEDPPEDLFEAVDAAPTPEEARCYEADADLDEGGPG